MLNQVVEFALKNRVFLLVISLLLCLAGAYSLSKIPIDAVPDVTNVQVVINTKTGALDPEQIEKTVTHYIETELSGIPAVEDIRSLSRYGLSQVTVIFQEGTNIYWARQQVGERLGNVKEVLPKGIAPEIGPIATGIGEVLMYAVLPKAGTLLANKKEQDQLLYLRSIQDNVIRPYLKGNIPNIAEVDSIGGYKKEIHIDLERTTTTGQCPYYNREFIA